MRLRFSPLLLAAIALASFGGPPPLFAAPGSTTSARSRRSTCSPATPSGRASARDRRVGPRRVAASAGRRPGIAGDRHSRRRLTAAALGTSRSALSPAMSAVGRSGADARHRCRDRLPLLPLLIVLAAHRSRQARRAGLARAIGRHQPGAHHRAGRAGRLDHRGPAGAGATLVTRNRDFVRAARSLGAGVPHILWGTSCRMCWHR